MYSFFAYHSRLKYINRWALMRNTMNENLSEHSNDVACFAHAIATIKNLRFGGNVNAERCAVLGLYHDMPEIITGDMPTPVKYHSEKMRAQFEEVENLACQKLLDTLPEDLKKVYTPYFLPQEEDLELWKIVKAADKISALVKCVEEKNAGNTEFRSAYEAQLKAINEMNMPEVNAFMEEFFEAFNCSLDELE